MSNLEKIGTVWSRSKTREFAFLIDEGKEVKTNQYVLVQHPIKKDTLVLSKTYDVIKTNPLLEKPGPETLLLRKYTLKDIGEQEIPLGLASTYGYFDNGRWHYSDVTPGTGQSVYEADEDLMRKYAEKREGLIQVGRFRDFNLANELDIDALNQHMFVCGMTGSGKTTFVQNLIASIIKKYSKSHILIFDTKGDYKSLEDLGANVIPYYELKPSYFPRAENYVEALYLDPKTKAGQILHEAAEALLLKGEIPNAEKLIKEVEEIAPRRAARESDARKYIEDIKWSIERYKEKIEVSRKPKDLREELKKPLTIVDFSCDYKVLDWQFVGKTIFEKSFEIAQSGEIDGILLVVEEAQWWTPETGFGIGEPSESRRALTQTMSQGRSFNLGYIIISQRPQSVTKGAISQCGTYVCFRVRNVNDHRQIQESSEYYISGSELAGLDDHEGLVFGAACPYKFPVSFYTDPKIFPAKGGRRISESWK